MAQMVASFPELRALLATDTATVRDFLSDYRERNGHDGVLIALDGRGQVVARSDTFALLTLPDVEQTWLAPLAEGRPARGFVTIDGHLHHAVASAAESGRHRVRRRPRRPRPSTIGGPARFVMRWAPIFSWCRPPAWKAARCRGRGWRGRAAPTCPPISTAAARALTLTGERFQAVAATLDPPGPRRIIVLQSRDQALAPYRNLQLGLILLGVVAAALGIAGSAWLAKSIAAPIGQLVDATQKVAAGNFDGGLDVPRVDEIGQLARAFNQMTAGLRERADMTKFVSASTMEMIQRRPEPGAQGGAQGDHGAVCRHPWLHRLR